MAARAIGTALLRSKVVAHHRLIPTRGLHGRRPRPRSSSHPTASSRPPTNNKDHRNGDEEKFSDILVQGAFNAANFWILSGMFYLWWVKPIWEDLKERSDNAAKERLIMKDEITRACQRIQDILEDYQERSMEAKDA
ncbi:hypothetical protein ACP70R_008949 [Stipagrostis hirtigluma subsp. patula]